jgi:hypothetical protein
MADLERHATLRTKATRAVPVTPTPTAATVPTEHQRKGHLAAPATRPQVGVDVIDRDSFHADQYLSRTRHRIGQLP